MLFTAVKSCRVNKAFFCIVVSAQITVRMKKEGKEGIPTDSWALPGLCSSWKAEETQSFYEPVLLWLYGSACSKTYHQCNVFGQHIAPSARVLYWHFLCSASTSPVETPDFSREGLPLLGDCVVPRKSKPNSQLSFLVHLQAQCRDIHGCPMLSMSGSSQLQQTHHRAQLRPSAMRGMPLGKCIQGRAERLRNSRTPVSEKEEEEGKLHVAGADTHTAASWGPHTGAGE